jgi:2'-5' RNA ligase
VKRLFVALDLDSRTRDEIAGVSSRLRDQMPRVKASWVRTDRMHLTLFFFGSADAAVEERLQTALERDVDQAPFDLGFGGIGFFPPGGAPRVLWMGVQQGLAELMRLHGVLEQRLDVQERSARPFTPHLTLARFREGIRHRDLKQDTRRLAEISVFAGPCPIDRVTLYESRLSPGGPSYLPLAQARLQPWISAPSPSSLPGT